MDILLLGNKTLYKLKLPLKVEGSFFLNDPITGENVLIVEASGNKWVIFSTSDAKITDKTNTIIDKSEITDGDYFFIDNNNKKNVVYCQKSCDDTFKMYKVNSEGDLTLGKNNECNISYNNPYIKDSHFTLNYSSENKWILKTEIDSFVYLNNALVNREQTILSNGDTIFTYGLKIVVMKGFVFINNPQGNVSFNTKMISSVVINEQPVPYQEVKEVDFYKDDDYYFNTPRIRRFIETYNLSIANPPGSGSTEEMPLLLTLGPMLTMGLMSVLNFSNVLSRVISGETTFAKSWLQILSSVIMLTTTFLWPNLTRKYQKKQKAKREEVRKEKYLAYLEEKRKEIISETINQQTILKENLLSLKDYYEAAVNKSRTLWERKITQKDFLTVRVGIGDRPIDMKISFNEDEFVIEKDVLKEVATKMVDDAKMLHQVPISYSFFAKPATAIMGKYNLVKPFIDNLLLQMMASHSYDELKIVVFTNDNNKSDWDVYKESPHLFSNDKSIRFFASDTEDAKNLSNYLETELIGRITNSEETEVIEKEQDEEQSEQVTYKPYYLIITDDYMKIRKLGICDKVFDLNQNVGFSFVILDNRLSRLPSSCTNFIMLDNPVSSILKNELDNYQQQPFTLEIDSSFDMSKCVNSLANVPIEFEQDIRFLPNSLTFLEMFGVGKVEQLNIMNRWKMNDPTKTLRAALGVNDQANIIYLDLHEKFHGPHGLIAGTTGSGKSELIITYILSMAINYNPNEVAFILIDYKGGGLAGAFENKKNNIRLPHLAGTITNLDKNEMNRTLVSIQSELKRRQTVFNEARDFLGESTIDIYKYQKFFREHKLEKPMPHLFIICDEFAELKAQQPDFMDNLISAARIGRSLGVHLILATQKPSGVVNDQIWSNTKFRICLKVANTSDSNEIIKCPDAAEIKNAGRFYLQVGTNEVFVLGQSGWCGAPYIPSDILKKDFDRSVSFIDDGGNVIKNISDDTGKKVTSTMGDELSNILKYITMLAQKESVKADTLWLDSIPAVIYMEDIIKKYNFASDDVTAIIGEYDDPSSQYQNILTLPLDENANTLVYSLSSQAREMFIRTVINSASTLYSSERINFYVMDFGSETFKILTKLPHVGDVVFSNESEKIDKLYKMLDQEIVERKKLFADYNGDYSNYCKFSGKTLPLIMLIINNFESYNEIYANYEEILMKLGREGKRYGIVLLITSGGRTGLYSRFTKNFDNTFVLNMNSKEEYIEYLGKVGNVYPAEFEGRGLYKKEIAYEFQTASICEEDKIVEYIKEKAKVLSETNKFKAKSIPVLPDVVTIEDIIDSMEGIKAVPIGLMKETLNPLRYNFKADKAMIIGSNELESCQSFLGSLLKIFKRSNDLVTVLFDFKDLFQEYKPYANSYCNNNFDAFMDQILKFIETKIVNTNYNLILIITGLDKYMELIDSKKIDTLNEYLKKNSNINIIYIDSAFNLKKVIFEPWYTDNVINTNGIWIGPGVGDQAILRSSNYDKRHSMAIKNNFAWAFKNGATELVKLVEDGETNEKQNNN